MDRYRADKAAAGRGHALLVVAVAIGVAATTGCLTREARNMDSAGADTRRPRYGFRHDPMQWVENDRSLQGALVRGQVFDQPGGGDGALIRQEIEKVMWEQLANGSFGNDPAKTAKEVRRVLDMGCAVDDARVQRAGDWILGRLRKTPPDPEDTLGVAAVLCLTGHGRAEERVFTADQGVWFDGWDQPMLIKSDRNGWRLLDYGDRPFAGPTDFFSHPGPGYCDGMAWDGSQLWALDARNRRLCVIEKTESGREITDALAARRD